jgi:glucan-binding YG repeat protein
MKTRFALILVLLISLNVKAQIDTQKRFQSDSRKYYVWNTEFEKYELKETEYENSVVDIREIGSKTNGYIAISMIDNGQVRLHHGSITEFSQTSETEGTWYIRSKFMRAKLIYNPKENTITYLYDAENKRYSKLMIFSVVPDALPNASLKTVVKTDD